MTDDAAVAHERVTPEAAAVTSPNSKRALIASSLAAVLARVLASPVLASPVAQLLLLVGLFVPARNVLTLWPTASPSSTYTQTVLFVDAAMDALPGLALLVSLAVSAALFVPSKLRDGGPLSWRDVELRRLRPIFAVCAIALAWTYSCYPYNFFLGQAHVVDRLMLIALAIGTVRHPAFFPPFLWLCCVILGQFNAPIGYAWTDIDLVVDASVLLVAFLALRALGIGRASGLLAALLLLIGAEYYDAARIKLMLSPTGTEWMLQNDIANIFVSSHLNGWLPDLERPTVERVAAFITRVAVPLQIFTFVAELGGAFILASRRFAIVLLLACVVAHIGIVLASGIFFWKWIVLDVVVAFVLWRTPAPLAPSLAERVALVVVALPIVYFSQYAGISNNLGWYDTRLSQYHQLIAVTTRGERYRIDEMDLAPFDKTIAQDRLFFAHETRSVTTTLGATGSFRVFQQIQNLQDEESVRRYLKLGGGKRWFDEEKRDRFATLFEQLAQSRRAADREKARVARFLSTLAPPMHIMHRGPSAERLPDDVVIETVELHFRQAWYDGAVIHDLSDEVVFEVPLSQR